MTASTPLLIDQTLLDALSQEASTSPRLRKNYNFHGSEADLSHRLLNAIEPGSYLVPHRHLDPNKDETMTVLRGQLGVVIFDTAGNISRTAILSPAGDCCGINIPYGVFHTVLACQPGTVMFESKAGPYRPLNPEELAPWAPTEGSEGAEDYALKLRVLFA